MGAQPSAVSLDGGATLRAVTTVITGINTPEWWREACAKGTPASSSWVTPFPVDDVDRTALARQVVLNDLLLESACLALDGANGANTRLTQLHYINSGCVLPPVRSRFLAVDAAVKAAMLLRVSHVTVVACAHVSPGPLSINCCRLLRCTPLVVSAGGTGNTRRRTCLSCFAAVRCSFLSTFPTRHRAGRGCLAVAATRLNHNAVCRVAINRALVAACFRRSFPAVASQ